MTAKPNAVVVVGAGMAGLTAAIALRRGGHRVVVVDKARGVGGRLATRTVGAARIDHGAQFFTARSPQFKAATSDWVGAGAAYEWCHGFQQPPEAADGHPRYAGRSGMSTVAKAMARDLDVRIGRRVSRVEPEGERWTIRFESGDDMSADSVLLSAPVAQSLALIDAERCLSASCLSALLDVRYEPTLAALIALDTASVIPMPGGVQLEEGPFTWVADNQIKGISQAPAVTLHMAGPLSAQRYDDPAHETIDYMVAAARAWLGSGEVVEAQLQRWRYARPTVLYPETYALAERAPAPLVLAGDAFGQARVEGAALSGWAAAEALLSVMA